MTKTNSSKSIIAKLLGFFRKEEEQNIYTKAKAYGNKVAKETRHKYDGWPYSYHYDMTEEAARQFLYLIPAKHQLSVLAAIRVHDAIEDHRQTYNDVKNATDILVAELAYAVSNNKGKTRSERADAKYYEGIRHTPFATFVKFADRIANIEYSKDNKNKQFYMYKKEHPQFVKELYNEHYLDMIVYMEKLFKD